MKKNFLVPFFMVMQCITMETINVEKQQKKKEKNLVKTLIELSYQEWLKETELLEKETEAVFGKKTEEEKEKNRQTKLKKITEDYKNYEKKITYLDTLIEKNPATIIFGGLHYGMSLDQIRKKLTERFQNMKNKGLIITLEQFENIKKDYYIPGETTDLTRIWGANYLKQRLANSKFLASQYDVPKYIIVANNPNKIDLNVYFSNELFPIPSELEPGAKIYFKKIVGKGVGTSNSSKLDLQPLGYADFSDIGNIINENKSGKKYIVDTEFKSFEISIPRKISNFLHYTSKRFHFLHSEVKNKKKFSIILS